MKKQVNKTNDVLKLLVGANRDEVARFKLSYAARVQAMQTTGQDRIAAMKASLPKNIVDILDKVGNAYSNHPDWPVTKSTL